MNPILKALCALPTAPFREQSVIDFVTQFARDHELILRPDRYGNLLLSLPRTPRGGRWIFVAHMDHPGLIATASRSGNHDPKADFRGHVLSSHMENAGVLFFPADHPPIKARIISATPANKSATQVTLRCDQPIPAGTPGMFDLPVAKQKGTRLLSRALDDLAGVAAALAALLHLRHRHPTAPAAALLTRGEETGFIGAIAALQSPSLLRAADRLISIECSAEQPYAPQGNGVVIRVGDKTSVFDSELTWQLTQTATALARRRKTFRFQRALMPGGTCEATAFSAFGHRAAALCIPLGAYHNMIPGKRALGPEYIDLRDWDSLLTLLCAIPLPTKRPAEGLRDRLQKRFRQNQSLLLD